MEGQPPSANTSLRWPSSPTAAVPGPEAGTKRLDSLRDRVIAMGWRNGSETHYDKRRPGRHGNYG